jgi:hypothetical protein
MIIFMKRLLIANLEIINEFLFKNPGLILLKNASHSADGVVTVNYAKFLDEERFTSAYIENTKESFNNEGNSKYSKTKWRAHIVTWAFNQARFLEGDLIEFGVYWGSLMGTACTFHDFQNWNKTLFLVDSWGGVNSDYPESNRYSVDIFEKVKFKFEKFQNVKLVRGIVPEVLKKITCEKISFISLDMNDGLPERLVLEALWDKIVPGGIVYMDDYCDQTHSNLRQNMDEFFIDKKESILCFHNSCAIVVKAGIYN